METNHFCSFVLVHKVIICGGNRHGESDVWGDRDVFMRRRLLPGFLSVYVCVFCHNDECLCSAGAQQSLSEDFTARIEMLMNLSHVAEV